MLYADPLYIDLARNWFVDSASLLSSEPFVLSQQLTERHCWLRGATRSSVFTAAVPLPIDDVSLRPVGPKVGASPVGVAFQLANLDDDACQRFCDLDRMNRISSRPFPGLGAR